MASNINGQSGTPVPTGLTDNLRKYKIIFHFAHRDEFLDGCFMVVKAIDPIIALEKALDYRQFITVWKGKTVFVNFKYISYAECEEV